MVFAAWWNPLSWFDNWSFFKKDVQVEVLEDKVQELEQKLEANNTATNSEQKNENESKQEAEPLQQQESSPVTNSIAPTPTQTTAVPQTESSSQIQEVSRPEDFRTKCELSREKMEVGQNVRATINVLFDRTSLYDVVWNKKYLEYTDKNEAFFEIYDSGPINLSATVTRKSDGYSQQVVCPITVECNEISCLKGEEKTRALKRQILSNITNEIETWYDGEYEFLGPVDRCETSESIIRAHIFEYTSIGGVNVPEFDKDVDCQNAVGPKAYQYKIDLLRKSI